MRTVVMGLLVSVILVAIVLSLPAPPVPSERPCLVGAQTVDPDACER
jgi:hypothetical protein